MCTIFKLYLLPSKKQTNKNKKYRKECIESISYQFECVTIKHVTSHSYFTGLFCNMIHINFLVEFFDFFDFFFVIPKESISVSMMKIISYWSK